MLLGVAALAGAQEKVSLESVLERFRGYLGTYYQAYAATVAIEHYTQRAYLELVTLESEFAMVRVPGREEWLGFRDVMRRNGKQVAAQSGRLAELFAHPTERSFDTALTIGRESARFNIGGARRTVNNPAVVLEVLAPRHHDRFRFSRNGEERVGDIRALIVGVVEHARPTIVQSSIGNDEPMDGRLWIDPDKGTLLRASIRFVISNYPRESLHLDVTFKHEPKLEMWVPARMRESHETGITEPQTGDATYSEYRQFEVKSRIVP
jgi:hypothetical protein